MFGICRDAEPAGTLIVTEKATACAPGVMVVIAEPVDEAKEQVAPVGSVLCKHESVIGCPGTPVFAFNRSEYVADPPGEMV